ncbi:MAG: hypothetical protein EOP45_11510 [Sphingobacteriaceae bacterium]|nr:MAG: hypothetical protein EOP45_11510 [Sphingobacteriaceae bacterium]
MKNRIKILLVLPFLFVLLAVSCKKDDLPKATQSGANTIAAKINGKAWQKKACTSCIGGGSALEVNYDDRNFFGVGGQNRDQNITISIIIKSLKSTGTYELTSQNLNYTEIYSSNDHITYSTSMKNKGRVIINKLDLTNHIISGTFEFTGEDENNPTNTIKVTDGWFDVKYY